MSTDPLANVLARIEGRVISMAGQLAELADLSKKAVKLVAQLKELLDREARSPTRETD